jgi:hypothetical protein
VSCLSTKINFLLSRKFHFRKNALPGIFCPKKMYSFSNCWAQLS